MVEIQCFFDFNLSPEQLSLAENLGSQPIFLEGPAGSGKTTAAAARMVSLLSAGVPANSILLLVPGKALARPFHRLILHPEFPAGRMLDVFTLGSITRRMVQLFWPVVSLPAGFARPDQPPVFLNLETAQYFMAHLVRPQLEEGLFSAVHIDRNRLFSQILDNMNKSALVGFPLDEIGSRLKDAWMGEPAQLRIFEDVQTCVHLFRQFCLAHNLVDYSLQVEIFTRYLWHLPLSRDYLRQSFAHLIYDNLEEDVPVAHDLIIDWLPEFETSLLIYDLNGGLRIFLGADPHHAESLKNRCPVQVQFTGSWVCSPAISALQRRFTHLERFTGRFPVRQGTFLPSGPDTTKKSLIPEDSRAGEVTQEADPGRTLHYAFHRFFPQMLDWVADEIADLVNAQGLPPGEIAVLAPFLSDALRFSLSNRLQKLDIPTRSYRPSRPLRDEAAAACLLTLAALVYPQWGFNPSKYEVVRALMQAIDGLDLVRGQLLADIVYRERADPPEFTSFDRINPEVRDRLSYRLGERFERLRSWLESARQGSLELDIFLSRLFGEVLSQPGFGFHRQFDAGRVSTALINSVRGFRQTIGPLLEVEGKPLGKEYLQLVRDGVLAAQNLQFWQGVDQDAVLLAPAYTFLMFNRPVEVQFWLDIGSRGWAERLYQPLTHPYVLSRQWQPGRTWSDADEVNVQEGALYRLVLALTRRCRRGIYLGYSDLGESGFEQRGPLLRIFNRLISP